MRLRIVELEGNLFAVQCNKQWFGNAWGWMSITEYYEWSVDPEYIKKYCIGTLEQAEKAIEIHISKIKGMRKPKSQIPKIIKVVKQVRV